MRSLIFLFFALFLVSGIQLNAQKPAAQPKKQGVHMTFDQESIPLGKMKKGDKKTFDYVFTNTGTEVIEIEIVSGCDCTTLDWTRKPIKPGEKGKVNVIFDSKEKEITETMVDVDIYLKNRDPKTNSQILKILNYTFELHK
ncbi:MAG: DUF1573 domain-containing protein [Saprospiraceae bacterium]|jgi:peptidoglycan-associated lipoprotein|nr:DUF1573 domain-containing protein [Saprospiraceae bacterium]